MPRGAQIPGFDYRLQRPVAMTRRAWLDQLRAVLKAGGRRRVDAGETFAHGRDALLVFEVYAVLPRVAA